ncbi:uncharacterized protein [Dysidea avara]
MAKPVCGPSPHFVVKDDDTTLKCRNYNDNGDPRGFVLNPLWYRTYSNGSSHLVGNTSQVTARSHTLIFHKMTEAYQGNYYCCTSEKDCSKPTYVVIAEPADIQAASKSYFISVGSNITLACNIISKGTPTASFHWIRQGHILSDELIKTNDTYTTLTLNDVTEKDSGPYSCAAIAKFDKLSIQKTIQLQVHPKITMYGPSQAAIGTNVSINCSIAVKGDLTPDIYITTPLGETISASEIVFTAMPSNTGNYSCSVVTSKIVLKARHHLLVVNDSTTSIQHLLQFLITFHSGDCFSKKLNNFQSQLTFDLEQYINRIQDGYISAVPTYFECINTSKALYDVEIRGDIGHEQLQNFQIEIQNVSLLLCNTTCKTSSKTEQTSDSESTNHTDSDDSSSSTMTAMTISVLAIIISGLICIAVVTLLVYVRYRSSSKQTDLEKNSNTNPELFTSTEGHTVNLSDANTSANTEPALVDEGVNNFITDVPAYMSINNNNSVKCIVPSKKHPNYVEIISVDDIS